MPAALLAASLLTGALLAAAAQARSASLNQGQTINVNVTFNTQMMLQEIDEQALVDKQQAGRKFMYRMASKECAVLKETIAQTCRLTKLNVSAQLREQKNQNPYRLYINGNAQFVITLKDNLAQ
ncbi:MAG: hypothetical protein MJE12_16085 [Alphaproteobacteria bacterium]|nr:hypothetical protein [Alphaproteobacteria bacterium]